MMLDNFDLYDVEEKRLARAEKHRPHCDLCGEPIWDDYAYRICDLLICECCVEDSKEAVEAEEL